MNISLPETLGTWVTQQAQQEGYNSADAYVQELLRRERERRDKEALEQRLLRALDSGAPVEVTSAFWEERRRVLEERLARQAEAKET